MTSIRHADRPTPRGWMEQRPRAAQPQRRLSTLQLRAMTRRRSWRAAELGLPARAPTAPRRAAGWSNAQPSRGSTAAPPQHPATEGDDQKAAGMSEVRMVTGCCGTEACLTLAQARPDQNPRRRRPIHPPRRSSPGADQNPPPTRAPQDLGDAHPWCGHNDM